MNIDLYSAGLGFMAGVLYMRAVLMIFGNGGAA